MSQKLLIGISAVLVFGCTAPVAKKDPADPPKTPEENKLDAQRERIANPPPVGIQGQVNVMSIDLMERPDGTQFWQMTYTFTNLSGNPIYAAYADITEIARGVIRKNKGYVVYASKDMNVPLHANKTSEVQFMILDSMSKPEVRATNIRVSKEPIKEPS